MSKTDEPFVTEEERKLVGRTLFRVFTEGYLKGKREGAACAPEAHAKLANGATCPRCRHVVTFEEVAPPPGERVRTYKDEMSIGGFTPDELVAMFVALGEYRMPARHELARVAHALLLELISGGEALTLSSLVKRLEDRIVSARRHLDGFDFAFWARGTLAEVLTFLADGDLIVLEGAGLADLRSEDAWEKIFVRRTSEGLRFLQRARVALPEQFAQLEESRRSLSSAAVST